MLRLSVVISIKVYLYLLPPTAYHPCRQCSKPCATPLCGPRPPFFLLAARYWLPSLLPYVCLNLACDTFLLHFHALRRLCAHASYQHSKESRFRLVWWKVGLVAPRYAGTETVTVQQPHSSPAPRIGKTSDGTTRRESAFRESLCETTVSVLALQTSTWVGACASPRHVRG